MPSKPEVLKTRTVARSRLFEVQALELRFANGAERTFERLATRGHGAVMIIPLLDPDTLLLINEYAAGLDTYQLTLPKGLIDPGEQPHEAANRELMEEIGYGAGRLTPLKELASAPNYMSHSIQVFVAEELYPKRLEGDEPEPLEVVPYPVAEIDSLVLRPDFSEARVIAALLLWKQLRARAETAP